MHRRAIFCALLALAVPLPALALSGGEEPAVSGGPAPAITVSASLDSCGTAAATIVCKIDATWNDVPGANRYSASVTRADGSVVDHGDVGAGSASFWVPYVGNGTYTVTVSAYGTPPGKSKPRVIAKGSSDTGSGRAATRKESATGATPAHGLPGEPPDGGGGGAGSEPPREEPEEPLCEPPAPEPDPGEPVVDGPEVQAPAGGPEGEPVSAGAESAVDEGAELPDAVACPEPEQAPAP